MSAMLAEHGHPEEAMADEDLFTGVLPFVRTAEASSFRRAAERLGVTTAAVSKSVARLEDRLGVKLLVRTSRSVRLTPEGRVYLDRCQQAVASLQTARELVSQSLQEPRGEVRVTLSPVLARIVIGGLPHLLARHPHLTVRVHTTDRVSHLAEESIDVAIRLGGREDSALVARTLLRPRWRTVAAPALLARHGTPTSPSDLERLPAVRFVGPTGRTAPWAYADGSRPQVTGALVTDSGEQVVRAAVAGVGVAHALDFMVEDELREGRLVSVLDALATDGPLVSAVSTPERAKTPNVRAVVGWLAETFARIGSSTRS